MEKKICKGIIATPDDFNRIIIDGCCNCGSKNFSYFGVSDMYTCNNCKTKYAFTIKAVISLIDNLGLETEIKTYNHNDDHMYEETNEINVVRVKQRKLSRKSINYNASER